KRVKGHITAIGRDGRELAVSVTAFVARRVPTDQLKIATINGLRGVIDINIDFIGRESVAGIQPRARIKREIASIGTQTDRRDERVRSGDGIADRMIDPASHASRSIEKINMEIAVRGAARNVRGAGNKRDVSAISTGGDGLT